MRLSKRLWFGFAACAALSATTGVQADEDAAEALVVLGQAAEVKAGQHVEAAIVIGGDLRVAGHVHGPAAAIGGEVRVEPGATVDGPIAAVGGTLAVDETAQVEGPRVQVAGGDFSQVAADLAEAAEAREQAPPMWMGPVVRMFQVLALFVLGIFLVLLAPRQVQVVRRTVLDQPAQAALAGVGVLLGFIPLCILLAVSVVGIPLIPVTVLALLAMFILGLTGLAVAVGFRLPVVKGEHNLFGAMAAGLLLLFVVAAIPVVGAMVLFLAAFYGAGAVLLSRFGTRLPPSGTPGTDAQADPQPASATS